MFNWRPLWHSGTQNDRAMRKRDGVYLVIIFVLLWVCSHLWEQSQRRGVIDVIDKDTLVTAPTASGSQQVGTWTVSVPKIGVSVPKVGNFVPIREINVPKLTKNVPKAESGGDTATYGTEDAEGISVTDKGDSLQVEIPITQKKYEDSLYTAWVSGYRATLDSIRVRERTIIVAAGAKASKPPKIQIGLTGGYGLVGLRGETGAGWFVGLGVTVPLWPR